MSDTRKTDPRKYQPTLEGGTQTVSGGANGSKIAAKDSLTGKNSVTEYKPGTMPKGQGNLGGKNQ